MCLERSFHAFALDMWVDRYAKHRPLTQNVTRNQEVGLKLYVLPDFDEK